MPSTGLSVLGVQLNRTLIDCLADGRFHSGEALGEAMGLSRAAIWKQIRLLQDHGLPVESVRGQGYRVPGGIELLDEGAIRDAAGSPLDDLPIQIFMETDSTNQQALDAAREGCAGPFAILAERQSRGRGRRGRQWQSPLGANIYLSLALPFPFGGSALEGLSLVVGLAVAEAIDGLAGRELVQLKWPNDLWIRERKVGGILIELAGDLDSACMAIVGVGLNLAPLSEAEMAVIEQPVTDLRAELGETPGRNLLVATLLEHLLRFSERFARDGFPVFASAWQARNALAGREVVVALGDRQVQGVCEGVSGRGALLLREAGGVREFHGGEVSLRLKAGKEPGV